MWEVSLMYWELPSPNWRRHLNRGAFWVKNRSIRKDENWQELRTNEKHVAEWKALWSPTDQSLPRAGISHKSFNCREPQLFPLKNNHTFVRAKSLSCVWFFGNPWTVAHSAPLHMVFSQARILESAAISYSRGYCQSRDRTLVSWVSCISRQILYH